ncbi:MAG: ATPase central domain-containing protein [Nitrosopumilales archaeon]|nr:MAG: ATPase central domain-containing protein [Nitrosopumilales archaeon]
MMWSDKHRPQSISEMIGNEEARSAFVEWFAKWKKGIKPLLLVGPPGIGKTTIANLAGKQFGYDTISLNASDVRSKSRISEVLSPVLGHISVFGSPMIFVDEVDGIHGRADFGGAEALIKILKEPTVPIVLAANSDKSEKMKSIKKAVKTIYFRPLPPRLLRLHLENILKKEGAKLSPGALIKIINESRGDIRSMINSTQALVTGFNPPSERTFEMLDVEAGVNAFFKANSIDEARSVIYSMSIDPREKINAFYSSIITSNLSKEDSEKMLNVLSEADILYGKIMKTQEWRLLRYLDNILLRLFKHGTSIRYSKYNLSWPLLNRLRWDGRSIKALASTMAKNMHVSKSVFATFYFPYMLFMIKNKKLELQVEETYADIIEKEIDRLK